MKLIQKNIGKTLEDMGIGLIRLQKTHKIRAGNKTRG
jgi:hypothetical protein